MHDWYQQNTDAPNWRKMSWKENETVYSNSYSKIKKVISNTSSANVWDHSLEIVKRLFPSITML